jgi:hypothetical protein
MGLDISAYSKVQKLEGVSVDDADCSLYHNPDFPGRADDVPSGPITHGKSMGFRAGSYGGYNAWRDDLARLAGFASAGAVWREKPASGPFLELIYFSDCEGTIGTAVSKKLAADFAAHQGKADASGAQRFREVYADFRKAFELAYDDGAVAFH